MWWLPLVASILGGGVSALTGMSSQNRENNAKASAENREREEQFAQQQRRAVKLEDVAGMFRDYQSRPAQGSQEMAQLAQQMQGMTSVNNMPSLERAAMEQLQRQGGVLDASLASRGVYSSGGAMRQHRGLASDTLMGLAQQIAQDRQAGMQTQLQGAQAASGIYGQLGQMDAQRQLSALQGLGTIYGDEAFGFQGLDAGAFANNPRQPSPWDWLGAAMGGAFGGAGSAFGADPTLVNRFGQPAPNRPAPSRRSARNRTDFEYGYDPRYNVPGPS